MKQNNQVIKNKNSLLLCLSVLLIFFSSCKRNSGDHDASGVFEADEVIVSSETNGRILTMNANEGVSLKPGDIAVEIDTVNLVLQKEQVEASIGALEEKTSNPGPTIDVLKQQLSVQKEQLIVLERDKGRIQNLVKADAAPTKQLDDIISQIDVLNKQMQITEKQILQQETMYSSQNRGILSERKPLEKKVEQLDDQLKRGRVINPVEGTVLLKYAEQGELASAGKPLYKIADLSSLNLRAFISGAQLSQVKLNQQVKVFIDDGADKYKEYPGIITWISGKAEFTPKTIQTKEERTNLVYAIKIKVKNDGFLKIGMYGEVNLK